MKNNIYKSDVTKFLSSTKKKYDLIIADPPYNQNIDEWDKFNEKEYWEFMKNWIFWACKALKKDGSIWIFNNPLNSAKTTYILEENNMRFQNWITWYKKDGFGAPKFKFRSMQETILFYSKSKKPKSFNLDLVRVPYKSKDRILAASKKGILKNNKRWFPNPKGALRSDVWEFSSDRHKKKVLGKTIKSNHATPKPEDLIETIVKTHMHKDMIVLDLFSGSGTTSYVCKKMDVHSDGVEINQDYVEEILRRLKYV